MEIITKNNIKKYSTYKNSGVEWLGEIPEHWDLTRLGTRFEERKTKVSDKDFAPLSVTKNGTVPQLASAAKSNDGDNRKLVKKGDFVINSRSDRKGSSGIAYQDGSVSLIYIVLEPLNIQPIYCNYLLKSYTFIEEFYRMGHGIVADLWTTRYHEMKSIIVGIPPSSEQIKIAEFLDDKTKKIDEAIAIKTQQINLLKERKQILIHKAVTRGLDTNVKLKNSGVEWIGKIPVHWEVRRLASFGKFSKGGGFSKADLIDFGISAILYGDIYTKYDISIKKEVRFISKKTAEKSIKIDKHDLLFTGSGETKEDIGKCVVFLNDKIAYAGGDVIIFKQTENDSLFLSFALNTEGAKFEKARYSKGEIIVHTYGSKLRNIYIPIPPLSEQKEISSYIEKSSEKIATAIGLKAEEISTLKEYKSSLINSVVTGKVRVC
ncbi:restriction endonuclease subunit S [Tenacibaculum finnmarkense]|uniref:restriction endonuclease subunit S n=1 Tax=Tenacibaculum finnmarkense TaxID=2781243 RepID=UPI001EFB30E6|nr:restriction endonuclease subunit S [Tenacibaculum finnmarkense]MCG8235863.1 restriction endonuclease subunit S [Tenacibaculum finnmarkense genomovar ulcerans]MCG8829805.1 restriction endonuclease subunit S [Tenacibaculum finnmarkense]